MSLLVSNRDGLGNSNPTRIGVLNDCNTRFGMIMRRPPSRIGIGVIVERHLLAMELHRADKSTWYSSVGINRGALMWIFSVTQSVLLLPNGSKPIRLISTDIP